MRRKHRRPAALRETSRVFVEFVEPRRLLAAALPADVVAIAQPDASLVGIVADPSRNHAFVGDAGNHALLVIDTQTSAQVAAIPLAGEPGGLAISPGGASVIVSLPYAHEVQVISTASLAVTRTLDVGVPILGVAGGAGGKFYGVVTTDAALDAYGTPAYDGSQHVAQFDLTTGARGPTLDAAGDTSLLLRGDATGQRVFIGAENDGGDDDVEVINTATPSALATLPAFAVTDGSIADVFDDRAVGRMYVANASDHRIDVVSDNGDVVHWGLQDDDEAAAGQITGVEGLPGGAYVFATIAEGGIGAGDGRTSSLVALDAATGAVVHVYALPETGAATDVAITPNGRVAFVADRPPSDGAYADTYGIGVVGAATVQLPTAANVVIGEVFRDANRDGVRQAGEDDWSDESDDIDESAVLVYVDLNHNGVLDARGGEGDASGDEPYTSIGNAGAYRLELPTASGTYAIRLQTTADYFPHLVLFPTKQSSRTVTLADGQQLGGVSFGIERGVEVAGTVFADLDGDGAYDHNDNGDGEPTVGGAQVYLDLNGDGQRQSAEPLAQAGDDGSYTLVQWFDLTAPAPGPAIVRLLNPKAYALTTPAFAAIVGAAGEYDEVFFGIRPQLAVTGTLYDDANANGKRDAGELPWVGARVWLDLDGNNKFTKGEPTALTSATGAYAFAAKERGTSSSLVLARDAAAHPLAIAQKAHSVLFTDWKQTVGGDLGAYAPASITISAFIDRDKNRKHNKGDSWLANTIVFLDANNNGKQDKHEPSAITDDEGHATFANLPPGAYVVRLRVSSKLKAKSVPTLTVTLAAGGTRDWSAAVRV